MRLNDNSRRWLPWLLLAIAVIVTAAVYWPGVTGGWVFDDYPNIVDNAAVHITAGHSTLAAWVNAALSSPSSFLHRPLASITFALNWMMGNGNPFPFKVTNIVIHLLNGVLLFCMLRALLRLLALRSARFEPLSLRERGRGEGTTLPPTPIMRDAEPSPAPAGHPLPRGEGKDTPTEGSAATRLALIVSAAWMLLPINLMAVLYVVQRMESLCQVFMLAGLWADLHGRWMMLTADDVRRDRRGLAVATAGIVLGTVLGLTSKETAVLLPVFAFLAEWIVLRFARAAFDDRNVQSARHTSLVIPGRPAGSNPESVSLPHTGQDRAHSFGEPEEGQEADSGSPLRGVRNDNGNGANSRNDGPNPHFKDIVIPGRPAGSNPESVSLTSAAEPMGDSAQGQSTDSGSSLRGIRNDNGNGANPRNDEPNPHDKDVVVSGLRPRQETESNPLHDKRIWVLFAITLFIPAVLGFAWLLRAALNPAAWSGRDFTLAQRLLTEPRVLVDYLQWTLFPNPMVLSLYHDEIVKSTGLLSPWTTLGSMVLLAALVVLAVLLRKRRPLVALGIGWFFAAQLLTATIIPLELVYEQRMYFGSIGVLLAVGALLLGLRWRTDWPLLRGTVVAIALLWFGATTTLRAVEWSNPIRLAVAEANRHPESPRAVYEAGRQLLIASNYRDGALLTAAEKYLRQAAAIPGSSALSDQALIMIVDHERHGDDAPYWRSMTRKLRDQPTRQEDISALISLTNCHGSGICLFDPADLQRAYEAALSRPHPIARLDGAYAAFQRDILHDDSIASEYLARAVAGDPGESAYRIDLAALYARNGQTGKALEQIDALRRMNYAGRLDRQIAVLERLMQQDQNSARPD